MALPGPGRHHRSRGIGARWRYGHAGLAKFGQNFKPPRELGGFETCSTYVIVPDAHAVYLRAKEAGASVTRPIEDTHYGSREFSLRDPEGHTWSVGTYNPWIKQE